MKKVLFAAVLLTSIASPAYAAVTVIDGTLSFGFPGGDNYFDPANGYVPAGYGNTTSSSVAIGSGVEFGFDDGLNLDSADFTGTSLTISDLSQSSASPFYMTFSSSTPGFFANARFVSNTFGGSFSVVGDTLSFQSPGASSPGLQTAEFRFGPAAAGPGAPAPEIGMGLVSALAAGLALFLSRMRMPALASRSRSLFGLLRRANGAAALA